MMTASSMKARSCSAWSSRGIIVLSMATHPDLVRRFLTWRE